MFSRDKLVDTIWFAAFACFVFLLGCFDLSNFDIWWHLRTGQLIWERGEVPRTDWFTYTNPEAPWIDLHWGFQLVAAALWSIGGSAALILFKSTLGAIAFGLCLTIQERDWPRYQSVLCWIPSALLLSARHFARPEVVTLVLLAATLAVLYHAPKRPRLVWLLPLIQLIWVNVHGLFVLQLAVLGCFFVDAMVAKVRTEERAAQFHWPKWLIAGAATVAASFANPYGARGVLFPLTLFERVRGPNRGFYHTHSAELKGIDVLITENGAWSLFTSNTPAFMLLVLFLAGIVSFLLLFARGSLKVFRLLIFIAFAYLTWQMVRNAMLFAIVGGVVVRLNIGDLVTQSQEEKSHKTQRQIGPLATAVCLGLLIASLLTGNYHTTVAGLKQRKFGFGQARFYGHPAAEFLKKPGMPDQIYAVQNTLAAVCIFHVGPEKRVFVDARLETNTHDTLRRAVEIARHVAMGDPLAEVELLRDIPADSSGERQLPALAFENRAVYFGSTGGLRLLPNLLNNGRWRCVFFHVPEPGDRDAVLDGSCVFVSEELAEKLELPTADASPLLKLIETPQSTEF